MDSDGCGSSRGLAVFKKDGEMPTPDEVNICKELIELWDTMNWDHARAVGIHSATTIVVEGYLIPEARIPSLSFPNETRLPRSAKPETSSKT